MSREQWAFWEMGLNRMEIGSNLSDRVDWFLIARISRRHRHLINVPTRGPLAQAVDQTDQRRFCFNKESVLKENMVPRRWGSGIEDWFYQLSEYVNIIV